jgi:hypothetical protein
MIKHTKPSWSLLKSSINYTPAASTDVQATWRRFGWKPGTQAVEPTKVEESIVLFPSRSKKVR